jgi:protein O-GlcNAc transferase
MKRLALALWCALLAAEPQPADVEAAWRLVARGRRDDAVALLRRIAKAEPRNADARLLLGSLLMEAGQAGESIDVLSEATRLRPGSADAHNTLGESYKAFRRPDDARREFERAIQLDSAYAQAYVDLAELQLEAGDAESAAPRLDRAIALLGEKPDAAHPRYLRAKIATERRDPAKAAEDLEKAVALRPDFAEAWSDLGEARKSLGDDTAALAAFQRAVALSPDDAVALTRLGSQLLDSGKAREAVQPLQQAARLDPRNQSTLNALQMALRRDGQVEQANEVRSRLAAVIHERDRADQNQVASLELNNRGAELEKEGKIREAAEKYRAALALTPDHVGIRVNLAVAQLKMGQWDEGIAGLREALRRDPGNTDIRRALDDALAQAKAHGIVVQKP